MSENKPTKPDSSLTVPVEQLSIEELLNVWSNHRNDLLSVMAANEVMKRLIIERNSQGQPS